MNFLGLALLKRPRSRSETSRHTQSVERLIKLVTEACGKVIGRENRDGYIMAKLASYKRMPKFESKKDYMP